MAGGTPTVPMETVLSPEQCEVMQRFFYKLTSLSDRYPTKKRDITNFCRQWREEYGQYWCGSHNGRKVNG